MADYLKRLQDLGEQQPGQDLKDWAEEVCKETRQVHISVWMCQFSKEDAARFCKLMYALAQPMLENPECGLYLRNLFVRLASVQNYLTDRGPFIPPGAQSDEVDLLSMPAAKRGGVGVRAEAADACIV